MKFIFNSVAVLTVVAIVLGAVGYNLMSGKHNKAGTVHVAPQPVTTDTREVAQTVTRVEANGPFDLEIMRGDKASAVLSGDERLLPRIVFQQSGSLLRISTTGMLITHNQSVKVSLILPQIEELTQAGSGDCDVAGFGGAEFKLNMTGSGDVNLHSEARRIIVQARGSGAPKIDTTGSHEVIINIAGSGDAELMGKTDLFNAVVTGTASVDGERLIASTAEIANHGNSNVKVYASKLLTVVNTAHGDVDVYGNPPERHVTNSGMGDVTYN